MYIILDTWEGILESFFDKRYSQMCDINSYPVSTKFLRRVHRSSTTTEGVKDNIAFITARLKNTFKKCERLLSWVAKAFLRHRVDGWDIHPNIITWNPRHLI